MSTMPWLTEPLSESLTAPLTEPGARPGTAILVTVASVEGSAPRETGAAMLVTATQASGTIGGGHLEFCAIGVARGMLQLFDSLHRSPDQLIEPSTEPLTGQRRLERLPLGPTLGQCCGGVVHLAFERIDPAGFAAIAVLAQRWQQGHATWRVVSLDTATPAIFIDSDGACLSTVGAEHSVFPAFDRSLPCHLLRDAGGKRWLIDPCLPYRSRLFLFGAGHVGAAIVRALAGLPCHVTWIDERAGLFAAFDAAAVPANVTIEVTDTPEAMVDAAPAGASFLVMTHSHSLDQRLAERILSRDDTGWFGLIGSRTKRIQFERRLRERGIAEQRIAAMICPIGVDGIDGKAPAVIATAVAAQLLQVWEGQAAVRDIADHYLRAVSQ